MTGAIASTVLTLVVVPLVHYLVERRGQDRAFPAEWAHPAKRKESSR